MVDPVTITVRSETRKKFGVVTEIMVPNHFLKLCIDTSHFKSFFLSRMSFICFFLPA